MQSHTARRVMCACRDARSTSRAGCRSIALIVYMLKTFFYSERSLSRAVCARLLATLLTFTAGAAASAAPVPTPIAAAPTEVALSAAPVNSQCPALLQHTFLRLQDEKPQSLCQYSGKVLLVVNTASFCGFTPQYEGLEALHAKYKAEGLVVLGFPSNDFSQESGSNKQIADFCENTFGVKFPMFVKSSVQGAKANPLFKQLVAMGATEPQWNFYKYLVGRDGRLVAAYPSQVKPDDPQFLKQLIGQLSKN